VVEFFCPTQKLFEFPVERDFTNEKAFKAAQYPFRFQIFLRIRFFEIEVRFFGTPILKYKGYSLFELDVKDIYYSKRIILYYSLSICFLNSILFIKRSRKKK
jgi:hypothetical protein